MFAGDKNGAALQRAIFSDMPARGRSKLHTFKVGDRIQAYSKEFLDKQMDVTVDGFSQPKKAKSRKTLLELSPPDQPLTVVQTGVDGLDTLLHVETAKGELVDGAHPSLFFIAYKAEKRPAAAAEAARKAEQREAKPAAAAQPEPEPQQNPCARCSIL